MGADTWRHTRRQKHTQHSRSGVTQGIFLLPHSSLITARHTLKLRTLHPRRTARPLLSSKGRTSPALTSSLHILPRPHLLSKPCGMPSVSTSQRQDIRDKAARKALSSARSNTATAHAQPSCAGTYKLYFPVCREHAALAFNCAGQCAGDHHHQGDRLNELPHCLTLRHALRPARGASRTTLAPDELGRMSETATAGAIG